MGKRHKNARRARSRSCRSLIKQRWTKTVFCFVIFVCCYINNEAHFRSTWQCGRNGLNSGLNVSITYGNFEKIKSYWNSIMLPKSLEVNEAFCGLLKRMVLKFVTVMPLNWYKQNKGSESLKRLLNNSKGRFDYNFLKLSCCLRILIVCAIIPKRKMSTRTCKRIKTSLILLTTIKILTIKINGKTRRFDRASVIIKWIVKI